MSTLWPSALPAPPTVPTASPVHSRLLLPVWVAVSLSESCLLNAFCPISPCFLACYLAVLTVVFLFLLSLVPSTLVCLCLSLWMSHHAGPSLPISGPLHPPSALPPHPAR